jgi:CO/xanthine dehydrogenase FAD-binding subunit
MPDLRLLEPSTVREASTALAENGAGARLLAGGTAVTLLIRQGDAPPPALVWLGQLEPTLRYVERRDGMLHVGAMARIADLQHRPEVRECAPLLAQMAARLGNIHVRNMATIGGNISYDPAADSLAPLIALDAQVEVQRGDRRRLVGAEQLFGESRADGLSHDDIITEVRVPARAAGSVGVYRRVSRTPADQRAVVTLAIDVARATDGAWSSVRLAIGSVASGPTRARAAENLLAGERPLPSALEEASRLATRELGMTSDFRGSETYKREFARVVVHRALSSLVGTT